MTDAGVGPEQPIVPQKASSETHGGRWNFLEVIRNCFSRKTTRQTPVEQRKKVQIPLESGYARWVRGLEEEINDLKEKKQASVDQTLTVNELTRLYPHFVGAIEKLQADESKRQEVLSLLNNGNLQTVIKLAEFVRDDYLNGQNIEAVKKKSINNLGKLELEAILADQLVNRLQRQKSRQEEQFAVQPMPSGIVESTEGIDLNP